MRALSHALSHALSPLACFRKHSHDTQSKIAACLSPCLSFSCPLLPSLFLSLSLSLSQPLSLFSISLLLSLMRRQGDARAKYKRDSCQACLRQSLCVCLRVSILVPQRSVQPQQHSMRDHLILVSCLTLLLSPRPSDSSQFQNGLMLGFILHSK